MLADQELISLRQRVARLEHLVTGLRPADRAAQADQLVDAIVRDAAYLMGLQHYDIISGTRTGALVRARFAVAWTATNAHGCSTARVGRALGDRDHSTIINALRKAEKWRKSDPSFRYLTDRLLEAAVNGGHCG